jgi:chromate reductase
LETALKKILFVPGSLRAASSSKATVRSLIKRLGSDIDPITADIGTLPLYNADIENNTEVKAWMEQIDTADGLIFVTPEYNYSVPGVLKNAIDWASRPAFDSVFKGKKCFVMSVSGGALGGVRAQADLKYSLNAMLAEVYTCMEVVVPQANTKVVDGHLNDDTVLDFAEENLRGFIDTL